MTLNRKLNLMLNDMFTSKIPTDIFGRIHFDVLTYELPSLVMVFPGSRQLKVVDVYREEQSQLFVPKHGWPALRVECFESYLDQTRLTMSLPKAPRIRVSVQCQDEPDNGIFVFTNPLFRPTVSRNANPCLWAFQCGLGVRLLAITLANPVPRSRSIAIQRFGCFHIRRR